MTNIASDRRIPGDWHPGPIPPNVFWGEGVYVESAQIFRLNRSRLPRAIELGNHVSCYAGCSFARGPRGSCAVGDFTLLDGAIVMAEERIEIRPARPPIATRPVVIEDDVWIGMGALILKGVRVGRGSVIGAGAVVTRDVPPNSIVAGNPAAIVRELPS